ncbi:MAG: T9SS type A sorting domain-containing protein [bacterium]
MKKTFLLLIVFGVMLSTVYAQQTENVFIAVIDGARYTETFGDSAHQYIPKIWNELRPLGTIYTSFYIDGQTKTNPGHASVLTGTWQNIDNIGLQRPNKPTLFEYFRKQKNTSPTENFVVLGKTKLNIISNSNHPEYGSAYRASVKTSSLQYDDNQTLENIKSVINDYHPRLVITNLAETDNKGHAGTWGGYVNAIKKVDNLIFELWNIIQTDSLYRNKTTLFVTNDHGRHSFDFTSHGDQCEGCRHIMLLVVGPDTPAGVVDANERKQIDIAPTVGHLLKIATPYSAGNVLETALVTAVAEREIEQSELARNFVLLQNYPNPFNPTTTIRLELPKAATVSLKIYNVKGQLVKTLLNTYYQAGIHRKQWDGTDAHGNLVSSGVYFYRLSADDFVSVKKMILVR